MDGSDLVLAGAAVAGAGSLFGAAALVGSALVLGAACGASSVFDAAALAGAASGVGGAAADGAASDFDAAGGAASVVTVASADGCLGLDDACGRRLPVPRRVARAVDASCCSFLGRRRLCWVVTGCRCAADVLPRAAVAWECGELKAAHMASIGFVLEPHTDSVCEINTRWMCGCGWREGGSNKD